MSDTDHVGYGKPPRKHQWPKGKSGNPRGRPRKHVVAMTPREIRRAILQIGHMQVPLSTPEGKRQVEAFKAIYMVLFKQAMAGQITSLRTWIKLYEQAIDDHAAENRDNPRFRDLEQTEVRATRGDLNDFDQWMINRLREYTRKNMLKPE